MKIKTKFKIISAVIVGLVLIIGVFVFIQVQELEKQIEENKTASEIMKGAFELNLLTSDYLLHPGERNQEQWLSRHQSIEEFLQPDVFGHFLEEHLEEQIILDCLRRDHEAIRTTFLKLTEESISPEFEERLVAELLVKSQAMLSDASRLTETSRLELAATQQRTVLMVTISIAILAGVMLLVLAVQARAILGPILSLQKGAEIIGAGNLKHRIDIKRQDEIGALAESFNNMSEKLKESYAGLEEKVRQRTEELAESLEQVSQERDKTDAILHSIGDGVLVIDKDYKIVLFNPVGAALSGFSIKEALGKNYAEILKFVYEKNEEINDKFIKEAMTTGEVAEMSNDTVLIRRDGSKLPVADSAAPLKDKKGKIIGCVIVFRDVSKEREVVRLKDDFLSIATHDLRAPASAVKGYLSMILEGDVGKISPQVKEFIEKAYEGNERAIRLINDFLNVSRIERGKIEIKPQKNDLIQIIEEVIEHFSSPAKEKGLSLEHKKIDLPSVSADKERVIEVLSNLLTNAIKYTEKGGVTISHEIDKNQVITHISDTGIGISEKDQKKLFEKFYRVPGQNNFAPATANLGLGLYICRLIINVSGGKIWMKSEEGKGSTFSFSLPICPEK